MSEHERGDIATRFQKGNKFWKARSSHGRNPEYTSKEDLQDAIEQYFEWVEETPLIEYRPMTENQQISMIPVPKMRAMTIEGCARFCGISYDTWCNYRKNPDFLEVIGEAERVIREQKLVGAAGGFLNASIVARDLGLKDASDVNVGGQSGNPIKHEIVFKPVSSNKDAN